MKLEQTLNLINQASETETVYTNGNKVYTIKKTPCKPENPRERYYNVTHLAIWRDGLGDESIPETPWELFEDMPSDSQCLPVYYSEDSNGIHLDTRPLNGRHYSTNEAWPEGLCGFIYCTPQEAGQLGKYGEVSIRNLLRREIKLYNDYLNAINYQIIVRNEITDERYFFNRLKNDKEVEESIREALANI